MSHFSLMVINTQGVDDVEEQLEPFSENLEVEEYEVQTVTQQQMDEFMEFYKEKFPEDASLPFDEMYAKYGDAWNGARWGRNEDGSYTEYSEYNPDAKWDWYEVGGRWCGFLRVHDTEEVDDINPSYGWTMDEESRQALAERKKLGVADSALKKNIDFESMMNEKEKAGLKRFDFLAEKLGLDERGHIKQPELSWQECLEKCQKDDDGKWKEYEGANPVERARDLYHDQDAVINFKEAVKDNKDFGFFSQVSDYDCTREEFAQRLRGRGVSTFAVLKDGEWFENGQMGWFGVSSASEDDEKDWELNFYDRFIKDLPEDALITIVDCHI